MSEALPLRDTVCVGCRFAEPAPPVQAASFIRCAWQPSKAPYWLGWYVTVATRTRPLREWTGRPQLPCSAREPAP